MNKLFVIDEDNKIYEVTKLPEDDSVKKFMLDNMMPITFKEIEEQKNDIIKSYYDATGRPKGKFDGYEFIFDYEQDETLGNLEWLEERLEDATEININDDVYQAFYNEAKQYGYCG